MCPYLRNGGIMVVILGTVAMPALSASAFRPPAFCVGRVTAARDSKHKRRAENLNLQFEMISDKIDRVGRKIDDVKLGLENKIDRVDRKIDNVEMGLDRKIDRVDRKIDDVAKDLETVSQDLSTLKTFLVVIAYLCVAAAPRLLQVGE